MFCDDTMKKYIAKIIVLNNLILISSKIKPFFLTFQFQVYLLSAFYIWIFLYSRNEQMVGTSSFLLFALSALHLYSKEPHCFLCCNAFYIISVNYQVITHLEGTISMLFPGQDSTGKLLTNQNHFRRKCMVLFGVSESLTRVKTVLILPRAGRPGRGSFISTDLMPDIFSGFVWHFTRM